MKAVRGAIAPVDNNSEAIAESACRLMDEICAVNLLSISQVVSVIFSATADLNAAYPAPAIRSRGYDSVPILCLQEMSVENALGNCLRVLLYVNTNQAVKHVYLGAAVALRPDLAKVD